MGDSSTRPWGRRRAIGRLVVIVIIIIPVTIATVGAAVSKYFDGDPFDTEPLVIAIGPLQIASIADAPPIDLLYLCGSTLLVVILLALLLEGLAQLRVLQPRHVSIDELPPTLSAPMVVVVIPAHNEELALPGTLGALRQQTRPPDRIVVVADNCADRTVEVAAELDAEVFVTVGNTARKAGALNQALPGLLKGLTQQDVVLVADADTRLGPRFIEAGLEAFDQDNWDAVGGLFYGEGGGGIVKQLQRNEYARYQLQIRHRRGRVFVLTGTASMFRAQALVDVASHRGDVLPGQRGDVYDVGAITEDNEMTIALKSLGCRLTSPQDCTVETELMPDWRSLWIQRKRWQRGALENLGDYGFTTATARYWGQQVGLGYGVIALTTAYALIVIMLLAVNQWVWYPFWVWLTIIFAIERGFTVWRESVLGRVIGFTMVLEIAYAFFLQANFVSSLVDIAVQRTRRWGHVNRAGIVDAS